LIDRKAVLYCQFFQSDPDQKGTPDVIALNARFTTLTAFQASDLLTFTVQLLNIEKAR
jgi:hypothetical protein